MVSPRRLRARRLPRLCPPSRTSRRRSPLRPPRDPRAFPWGCSSSTPFPRRGLRPPRPQFATRPSLRRLSSGGRRQSRSVRHPDRNRTRHRHRSEGQRQISVLLHDPASTRARCAWKVRQRGSAILKTYRTSIAIVTERFLTVCRLLRRVRVAGQAGPRPTSKRPRRSQIRLRAQCS